MAIPEGQEVSHGKLRIDTVFGLFIPTENKAFDPDTNKFGIVPHNTKMKNAGNFNAYYGEASRSNQPERIEAGFFHALEALSAHGEKPSYVLMRLVDNQLVVAHKGYVQLLTYNFDADANQLIRGGNPPEKRPGELATTVSTHELSLKDLYIIVSTGVRQLTPHEIKRSVLDEQATVKNIHQLDGSGSVAVIVLKSS